MLKVTLLLAVGATSTCGIERTKRSDLFDFYQSHVLGHYLHNDGQFDQHDADSDRGDLRKREVKLSQGGLFYHEGPYIAHGQVQRNAPKFNSPMIPQNKLPHHQIVTPKPYHAHPTPYHNYLVTTPSPVQYHGLAYLGHSTPAPHNSYPTPTPFHGPVTPIHYDGSPSPYYPSPAPYHMSPAPYHGTTAPYHGTPAPYHGAPTYFRGTPNPSPYHGTPTPYPGTSTPYHGTPIPYHVAPTPYYAGPTPYPKYKTQDHPTSIANLHYQGPSTPIQLQANHEVNPVIRNQYPYGNSPKPSSYSLPTRQPIHLSLTHNKVFKPPTQAGSLSFIEHNQAGFKSGPPQPIQLAINPTAIPKNLEPVFDDLYKLPQRIHIPRTQPKSKENHFLPPQAGQQTLFQSITKDTPDRPVHKKLSQKSQKHKIPKSDALQNLMAIAGDNWDTEIGIEKNLLDTASNNFICPGPEGHFPDPKSCSVYYQCAQGTPHKRTCSPGLNWDMRTNQCDWKANVDCSRSHVYRS